MSTLEEKIAVMQAFAEGKEIEVRWKDGVDQWLPVKTPKWSWDLGEYRVKPRKPREIWVNEYPHGLMDYNNKSKLSADNNASRGRIRCVKFVEVIEE